MSSSLPLSSLSIFPATDAQLAASRARTFVEWGTELSLDQYTARDNHLDTLENAAEGKLTTWVLAPRANPTSLDFLCSCETYRRAALVRLSGSSQPEDTVGYGVASVFTPAQNRRKGYARHMMSLLHWVMAAAVSLPPFPPYWGEPPIIPEGHGRGKFSVLYSDVGDFYAACGPDGGQTGWIIRSPIGTIWPVDNTESEGSQLYDKIIWLDEPLARELWREDATWLKEDVAALPPSNSILCAFLPDMGVAAFQLRRTHFFVPGFTSVPNTNRWGASVPSTTPSGRKIFITWTMDFNEDVPALVVTRLRCTATTLPILIQSALEVARDCGLKIVEVWNLPKELEPAAAAFKNGKTSPRKEHLPSFVWYGKEDQGTVQWIYNEKFAWC